MLTAHLQAPDSQLAPKLALAWVALRIAHGVFYLGDKAALRTARFAFAFVSGLIHVRRNFTGGEEKIPKGKRVRSVPMMPAVPMRAETLLV